MASESDQPAPLSLSTWRAQTTAWLHSRTMRKVPELTAYFWITKVLTTAMGEATSDYLVHRFPAVIAVALGGVALAMSLVLQFYVRRYVAWIYWLAVSMVAVFGTMAADALHIGLGIPYDISTGFFSVVLVVVFLSWHSVEKTLSIHSIYTPRREAFYWAAVMATFALGTAAGDMTASTMGLGYFLSGVLFAVLIAAPAVAYRLFGFNEVFAFWFAYVVTRPLGASFADWADKPRDLSGLGAGNGPVGVALTILIIGVVVFLTITRKDVEGGRIRLRSE